MIEDESDGTIVLDEDEQKQYKSRTQRISVNASMKPSELEVFRQQYRKQSLFKRVSQEVVQTFLRSRVYRDRDEAIEDLENRDPIAASMFSMLFHKFNAEQIENIWKHIQKSTQWLKDRFACRTGSEGGYCVNWNPYCNVIKFAYKKYWDKFTGNKATEHGSRLEKMAVKIYVQLVQQHINLWYVNQKSYDTGMFNFHGYMLRLTKRNANDLYFAPPIYEAWHLGGVRDPFAQWRQTSIDLLGTIRAWGGPRIPLIIGEIKIPWADEQFFLYPLEPMYYVPQPMDGIQTLLRLWPTIFLSHRGTYSHLYGMNIDIHAMDWNWYNGWFTPRDLRYTFGPQMQMMREYIGKLYSHKHPKLKLTPESMKNFLSVEFFVPSMSDDSSRIGKLNAEEEELERQRLKDSAAEIYEMEMELHFNSQVEYTTESKHNLFPLYHVVSKSPDVYFSECAMIHWRNKTIALDSIVKSYIHRNVTFYVLYLYNFQQMIWKDENAHFGRKDPYDPEYERDHLVESQEDYVKLWDDNEHDRLLECLDHELNMRCDFYWCVFVSGMQIVVPSHADNDFATVSMIAGYRRDRDQQARQNVTKTLPSLCMHDKFTKYKKKS